MSYPLTKDSKKSFLILGRWETPYRDSYFQKFFRRATKNRHSNPDFLKRFLGSPLCEPWESNFQKNWKEVESNPPPPPLRPLWYQINARPERVKMIESAILALFFVKERQTNNKPIASFTDWLTYGQKIHREVSFEIVWAKYSLHALK